MKPKFQFLITSIVLYALIFATTFTLVVSCTSNTLLPQPYKKGFTRVVAIGKDTSYSRVMYARTETLVLAQAESNYLKAELLSCINGVYTIKVTNKQSCNADFNWDWTNGLTINSIIPVAITNNVKFSQLSGNSSTIYTLTGNNHTGTIKLKASTICNWQGSSDWISLDITSALLPIKFISSETYLKNDSKYVDFTIDNPQDIDMFEIQWSPTGEPNSYVVQKKVDCDHQTKVYSIEIPAY